MNSKNKLDNKLLDDKFINLETPMEEHPSHRESYQGRKENWKLKSNCKVTMIHESNDDSVVHSFRITQTMEKQKEEVKDDEDKQEKKTRDSKWLFFFLFYLTD